MVADNGSTDGSQQLAEDAGARVVPIPERGYGAALMGGIDAARGRYVIMGDADDSYDFANLTPFIEELRQGDDLVMGNRFKGGIAPGRDAVAAPLPGQPGAVVHRPAVLPLPIGDFHCGLRGFRREARSRSACRPPAWSSPARWS